MKCFLLACLALTPGLTFAEDRKEESNGNDLYTNIYVVRPDFFEKLKEINPAVPPIIATKALENQGITFPPDGSVTYRPETSQLIVRNTRDQMELVEALVDHVNGIVDQQVYVTLREITLSEEAAESVGFDWMLSPSSQPDEGNLPSGKGVVLNSVEAFKEEFSRPPTIVKRPKAKVKKQERGIAGVFTDPQFQVVIRAFNQQKGVDLLSAPSVMARSGNPAFIQVEERRWGVIPVVGADGFTIDLELYLPSHGKPLYEKDEKPAPSARVTIWDGQTVAWSEKNDDGSFRLVFIKAQLMDPAGNPIHGEEPPAISNPLLPDETNVEYLLRSGESYEVKKGDTLHNIAAKSGVSVKKLSDANSLSSNELQVGQKLIIPKP